MRQDLKITFVAGDTAPRYNGPRFQGGCELQCEEAVITEQATKEGLPIVDFRMRDAKGNFYLLVLSGRIVNALSAAIKGVNTRIHGTPEP